MSVPGAAQAGTALCTARRARACFVAQYCREPPAEHRVRWRDACNVVCHVAYYIACDVQFYDPLPHLTPGES
eukprot:169181-Rhodomonas_salina.1